MVTTRNIDLDALKGIAILAVVFYHIGLLPFGYLGVDVFLVINGYFITHSLLYQFNKRKFSYSTFLKKRLVRLWPLLILASIVSLIIGYFIMMPDYYENLGQSVVATNLFANNILSCITTANYWDVVNAHKPLMHTWYVGILVQCYIIFPVIIWGLTKFGKKVGRNILILLTITFALLYILPIFPAAQKFYYLPFRLFEFLIGAIIATYISDVKDFKYSRPFYLTIVTFIVAFCLNSVYPLPNEYKVLSVSVLTGLGIWFSVLGANRDPHAKPNTFYNLLASIGIMSYSIFVWHQVAIAYYRHSISYSLDWLDYVILIIIIVILSLVSYYLLERKFNKLKSKKQINNLIIVSIIGATLVSCLGLYIYVTAGVTKDVPELEIKASEAHKGMHSEYCDRIYAYDRDFRNDGRIKALGLGDSFIRDWFNVILESEYVDSIDLSYAHAGQAKEKEENFISRLTDADIIYTNRFPEEILSEKLREALLHHPNVIGIGTKSFGETNGFPYARRNTSGYYKIRMPLIESVKERYSKEKAYYGENYVDFISPVIDAEGLMPVFTEDSLYISRDCRHLTHGGARFYAKKLDMARFTKRP